nr:unnamed protein product [Callosobruchus analis]
MSGLVLCKDNFKVNTKFVTCNCCCAKFHCVCISIKENWLKILADCENLFVKNLCDACKFKWKELAILKNQLQSLKRDKELIEKLNSELRYSNGLQKLVIQKFEDEVRSLKDSRTSTAFSSAPSVANSYSRAVMKTPVKPAPVLIRLSDKNCSRNQVFEDVTTSIYPAELKVCMNSTRTIKDGVAVTCENDASLDILRNNLTDKLGAKYDITMPAKLNPRLLIKNVRLKDPNAPEDVINSLVTLNNIDECQHNGIKFVTKLKPIPCKRCCSS